MSLSIKRQSIVSKGKDNHNMTTPWKETPEYAAIRAYVDDLYGGKVLRAANSLGVKYDTLITWYRGEKHQK